MDDNELPVLSKPETLPLKFWCPQHKMINEMLAAINKGMDISTQFLQFQPSHIASQYFSLDQKSNESSRIPHKFNNEDATSHARAFDDLPPPGLWVRGDVL